MTGSSNLLVDRRKLIVSFQVSELADAIYIYYVNPKAVLSPVNEIKV